MRTPAVCQLAPEGLLSVLSGVLRLVSGRLGHGCDRPPDPQQKATTMSLGTNDTESPNHSPEPPSRRRAGVLTGALLGAMALTAAVVGVSAIAGAQDSSADDRKATVEVAKTTGSELDDTTAMFEEDDAAWAAFDQCLSDALGPIDEDGFEDTELTDDEWEALEAQFEAAEAACEEFLPDDVKAEIAAFQPFDDCIDSQLGEKTIEDETELTDDEWEALEAQWIAAEDACFDLLPEDAKAEAEAFQAYDDCLADAGLGDDMGAAIYVEDGETGQSIQFGEDGGTVTITGDATGVSVTTDGDVSVLDDAAFEAAFEACDELLPDDLFDFDDFEDDESDD